MAVWFIDGFDHYSDYIFGTPPNNNTADMGRKWTTVPSASTCSISSGFARTQPGRGVRFTTGAGSALKTRQGSTVATLIVGCAYQASTTSVANTSLITLVDGSTEQVSVRTNTSGNILLSRAGTTLATSTNAISANTWYYIEVKATIDNSAGAYEVRVNGSSTGWIPAATGADTQSTANAQVTGFSIGISGNMTVYYDDVYAADATGSYNNDFLGVQQVGLKIVSANGNYAQFTPNGGTNSGTVREMSPDGDNSFNQSGTVNNIDSFLMTSMPISSGSITAIQHVIYARQGTGTQRAIAPFQRESSTDYVGTSVNLSTSYVYLLEPKDTDPATGVHYTLSGLDASEFGYKLTT